MKGTVGLLCSKRGGGRSGRGLTIMSYVIDGEIADQLRVRTFSDVTDELTPVSSAHCRYFPSLIYRWSDKASERKRTAHHITRPTWLRPGLYWPVRVVTRTVKMFKCFFT